MMFRMWACALLGTIVLTGCGGSGPKLVPVEGAVTLDGRPLANKSLLFTPIGDTSGHGAGGASDAEGRYTLLAMVPGATKDHKGIAPGRYRVTVFEPTVFSNVSVEQEGDEPVAALAPDMGGRESDIPAVYGTEQSPLVLDVPESGGTMDVELKSNPGG